MKAMTDFIETKLKPAVKSLSRETIEYRVVSEQGRRAQTNALRREALALTESKYAAIASEREALVEEHATLLEKYSANEKLVTDLRATLDETNRILESSRASNKNLELKLSEGRCNQKAK